MTKIFITDLGEDFEYRFAVWKPLDGGKFGIIEVGKEYEQLKAKYKIDDDELVTIGKESADGINT